jgi:hypothetical protein
MCKGGRDAEETRIQSVGLNSIAEAAVPPVRLSCDNLVANSVVESAAGRKNSIFQRAGQRSGFIGASGVLY